MEFDTGKFRFAYFTAVYEETCDFYSTLLGLQVELTWDRNENDKGKVFRIGKALIEVLLLPNKDAQQNEGLDYRAPQGAFMVIHVEGIDSLFEQFKIKGVPFKQEIVNQAWGHRSFSVIEPNGLVLMFVQDQQ